LAIEWYLSDAAPVHSLDIVRRAEEVAETVRCDGFEFGPATQAAAERVAEEKAGEFERQLPVLGGGNPTNVFLDASRMLGDDGYEMPDVVIFGSVLSDRTRLSTTLGLITALSWLSVAGGSLSGTGLTRHWSSQECGSLIRHFAAPADATFDVAVQHISRLLLGKGTTMRYA
jgi:hypothetical protein